MQTGKSQWYHILAGCPYYYVIEICQCPLKIHILYKYISLMMPCLRLCVLQFSRHKRAKFCCNLIPINGLAKMVQMLLQAKFTQIIQAIFATKQYICCMFVTVCEDKIESKEKWAYGRERNY